MKIFSRYIFREAFTFFAISLFAFTAVLLTIRMLHFAALIVNKGVAFHQIAEIFLAIVPTFLEIAIPLATLLGIMLAFARLSGDSEIVVMRTSGISMYQLVKPIVLFGLLAGLGGLYVSHQLKPWGYNKLSTALFDIARTRSTSGLDQGVFNKLGPLTIYAERINDATGELEKVLIDDRRDRSHRKIIVSRSGSMLSDEAHRVIIVELREGYIHEITEGKYTITDFSSNRINLDPDELFDLEKKQSRQAGEMTRDELVSAIAYYSTVLPRVPPKGHLNAADFPQPLPASVFPENITGEGLRKRLLRLKIELGQRYSLPFASFALALLALPLGIQPPRAQRTWGAGLSATLGMVVFVFYYALISAGIVFAQGGLIDPFIALWVPNICVLLVALYMIKKTGSEKWHSVAQGFEELILLFLKLFKVKA